MQLPVPAEPDALRPSTADALAAWTKRVVAERAQTDRCREVADPADFYAPSAQRFRFEPDRPLDEVALELSARARPADTWLDVGAGGGRYALPIAQLTRQVIAVDPSPAMLGILQQGMDAGDIGNVRIVEGRWPPADWATDPAVLTPFHADVALMAHVGYDIEDIGPFLDAVEATARRWCIAVMGDGAMTTVGRRYWEPIHGERRVALPALPDLITLLLARGCLPEVRVVPRPVPTYESFEALHERARRQLWLLPGSDRDRALEEALRADAAEADGVWSLPADQARIGIVTWSPLDPAGT